MGLGSIALATLMKDKSVFARVTGQAQSLNPLSPKKPHFAPKAKRVIYMFQAGAPSQLDLFDPKPALEKYNGQPVPKDLIKDQMYAFIPLDAGLYASPFKFARHGAAGAELSELLPNVAKTADDITIVRSMVTDAINHAPAQIFSSAGRFSLAGRVSGRG